MATTKVRGELVDFNAGRADYSLTATNTVTYVGASGGNQYIFNGAYGSYGVVNGTYVLSSVSSSHPIAIINNGKTSEISYTGAVNEGTGTGPDGNTYTFYSGDVTITVSGNFDTVSYYCLNHGYMGGKDNLIYVSSVGESGLKMPSGTEVNRPTAVAGQIRNNTNESSAASSSAQEYYNGSAWTKINNVPLPPEFKAKIYTGNSNLQSISGYGFRPDLVWIKSTDLTYSHFIFNSQIFTLHMGIYYAYQYLQSNNDNAGAEQSASAIISGTAKLQSFNSDGFSVHVSNDTNQNAIGYFGWGWKVNGGTTSSNGNGSVTSTVQANDDLGISIVEFTGTGGNNTIGHGLSSAPELILIKSTSVAGDWQVYADPIGATNKLILNLNSAQSSTTRFNNTSATSTVFSFNDSGIGTNADFVAYCFKSTNGNSKIGTYSGTGSSNPITGLGFSPTWVMIKSTTSAEDWAIFDTARGADKFILANTSATNQSFSGFSFDSDGFTVPSSSGMTNGSGQTYLYMAFR